MPQVFEEIARFLDGERPNASPRLRFGAGALLGGCLALFTPILLGLWAIEGAEITVPPGRPVRVDLLSLVYPLGAIVSGGLFCLLTSYASTRLARAVLGAVAVLPWFAAIALCLDRGYAAWQSAHTVTTLLGALSLGAPLGWISHSRAARLTDRATEHTAV